MQKVKLQIQTLFDDEDSKDIYTMESVMIASLFPKVSDGEESPTTAHQNRGSDPCLHCGKKFKRNYELKRHIKMCTKKKSHIYAQYVKKLLVTVRLENLIYICEWCMEGRDTTHA